MSRISDANVCADVAVKVGVLGGVCNVEAVIACLDVFDFSLPRTLPIVCSISEARCTTKIRILEGSRITWAFKVRLCRAEAPHHRCVEEFYTHAQKWSRPSRGL